MTRPLAPIAALSLCALALAAMALAPVALAHTGVTNHAVMARMEAMKSIGGATRTVGDMAKGVRDFDAATARRAFQDIAQEATRVPALFAAPEDDPKSEARAEIWTQFADFESRNLAMQTLAADFAQSVDSLDDLRAALPRLGETCSDCHRLYRE